MIIDCIAALEAKKSLSPWSYEINEDLNNFDVLIKTIACGICYSDVHMIDNDWNSSKYPLVPGHEVIGTVQATGQAVSNLKKGDLVGVGWQRSACLACDDCLRGNENLCSVAYQATVVKNHGGFGSFMVTDSRFAFPLPTGLDIFTSAPLLCGGITVYSALREAGMKSGQKIGVIGLGGLGHMAVQFASSLGNQVTVFTTSDDKAVNAIDLGASNAVVTKNDKIPNDLPNKLDIIINTVDHPLAWERYLRLLGSDGTLTFVGNPGNITVPVSLLLGRRRRITGSPIGGRSRIVEMLKVAANYHIEPVIEKYRLSEANVAIGRLRDNKVRYRAVLEI